MLHDPRRQQQQHHHHQQVRSPSSLEDSHRPGGGVQALPNGQGPWQGRPPSRHHHPHQHHPHQQRVPSRRPSSPSDSTSTSSDDREEMARSLVRRPAPPGGKSWQHQHQDGFRAGGGTLRSTRSVPALALATWDGEPCPVHGHGPSFFPPHGPPPHGPPPLGPPHGPPPQLPQSMPAQASMRRFGSMFDVRAGYYPMAPLDRKSLHGSMSALGVPPAAPPPPMGPPYMPPPHLMPPMMRPRPYVFPAEPLPTRDPFRPKTPVLQPPKLEQDYYSVDQVCCKGHLVVLWIILAVVTIGVILGIILGVTVT